MLYILLQWYKTICCRMLELEKMADNVSDMMVDESKVIRKTLVGNDDGISSSVVPPTVVSPDDNSNSSSSGKVITPTVSSKNSNEEDDDDDDEREEFNPFSGGEYLNYSYLSVRGHCSFDVIQDL